MLFKNILIIIVFLSSGATIGVSQTSQNNCLSGTDTVYFLIDSINMNLVQEGSKFLLKVYKGRTVIKKIELKPNIHESYIYQELNDSCMLLKIIKKPSFCYHGKFTEFYLDGKIKTRGKYFFQNKVGTWRHYSQDGILIKKEKFSRRSNRKS